MPQLYATLLRRGLHVRQLDLNAEFVHRALRRRETLELCRNSLDASLVGHFDGIVPDLEARARCLAERLDRQGAHGTRRVDTRRSLLRHLGETETLLPRDFPARAAPRPPGENASALDTLHRALGSPTASWVTQARLVQLLQRGWAPPGGFFPESVQIATKAASQLLDRFYAEAFDPHLHPDLDLVGLSLHSTGQLVPALKLAARIRAAAPQAMIVAGGPWCSAAGPGLLAHAAPLFRDLDGFVLGEGELALTALCAAARERRNPASVLGFCPRGQMPRPNRVPLPPLEALPSPHFDGLPFDLYPEAMIPFRTLRGCYWGRCRFCYHLHSTELSRKPAPRSHRMSERLLEQLVGMLRRAGREHGIRRWTTADNATPPTHLLQIARALKKAKLDTRWRTLARFEADFTPDLCRELADAGCERLELGLETSSATSRARLEKGVDDSTVLRNLDAFQAAGIESAVFILDYPSQAPDEFQASLDFVCRYHELISHFIPLRFALGRNSRAFSHPEWFDIEPLPGAVQNLDVFDLPFAAKNWQSADAHRSQWDEAAVRLIHLRSGR